MAKVSTYRAMISALVCTFLCVAMLCGMTYAWYLGTIDSGNNTINIGTYDVSVKWASNDFPESFTDTMSNGTVNFSVTGLGPDDYRVCYFQIKNNTDYPADVSISILPTNKDADIQLFCSAVSGTYTPDGAAAFDFASVTDETITANTDQDTANDVTTQIFTCNMSANSTQIVAVAVKLPETSMAVNATTDFTLKFNVQQTGNS